ncbi:MAG: ExbD/TolR family protein [Saccharospirillaceae bacterium]|nr:ExbD/TolR family protein [Pseudomonadales bacterium]NRB78546.1 ExbD/TolR family protein [Saccharospirillaceae bacterium]
MSRTKRKPMAQINVVPYIDVMLVLLIIFMVTSPMIPQGEKIDLPDLTSEALPISDISEHVTVQINAQNEYSIQRPGKEPFKEDLDLIGVHITKIITQNPDILVLIRADESINYGLVMELIGVLKAAGAVSVGLETEAPAQ